MDKLIQWLTQALEALKKIGEDIKSINNKIINRNLLKNSTDYSSYWTNKGPATLTDEYFLRSRAYKTTKGWQAMAYNVSAIANLDYAKTYTLSFYAKSGGDTSTNTGALYLYGKLPYSIKIANIKSLTTEWQRFSVVINFSESSTDTTIRVEPQSYITEGLFFSAFKLEEGDKLTEYSIAPEDLLVKNEIKTPSLEQKSYSATELSASADVIPETFHFLKTGNGISLHLEIRLDENDWSTGMPITVLTLPDELVPKNGISKDICVLGTKNTVVIINVSVDSVAKKIFIWGSTTFPVIGQPVTIDLFWVV